MKNLKVHIEKIIQIAHEDWCKLELLAERLTLKKGEILIRESSRFNKEVFVEKGVVRALIIDNEGNEKSTAFFQEGEFMSASILRTKNGRSIYTYQALCPTSLVLFDSEKFKSFILGSKKLMSLGKILKEKEADRLNARDECLMQVKAIDKYAKFRKHYPGIENKIAHQYIASYLGITPVSLSRIRKKLGTQNSINN